MIATVLVALGLAIFDLGPVRPGGCRPSRASGVQFATGSALFKAATWARIVAIGLVSLNAIAQLTFVSAHAPWAILIIALDMLILWALVVHGDEAGPVL